MTLVSQLIPRDQFINLSDEKIDNIWSILEAEILQSPEVLEHLRSSLKKNVTPHLAQTKR
jgi:hypothetical protein